MLFDVFLGLLLYRLDYRDSLGPFNCHVLVYSLHIYFFDKGQCGNRWLLFEWDCLLKGNRRLSILTSKLFYVRF